MNGKTLTIRIITIGLALILVMSVTGCSVIMGIFGPDETIATDSESTDTTARTLVPTAPAPSVAVEAPVATVENNDENVEPTAEPTAMPTPELVEVTRRMVTITGPTVNLRSQPSTDSEILVAVPNGTTFELTDQNSAGDWYQICCVNNSTAWVYGELASVEETVVMVAATPSAAPALEAAASTSTAAAQPVTIDIPLAAPVFTQSEAGDGTRYEYSEQGFAITLPRSWQPVDLSAERLEASLSKLAGENAQAAALVEEQLQGIVNARFTFYAVDATPNVLDTGFATNVSLLRQPLPPGITLDFFSQIMAKQAQESQALISPVSLTPGSVPAGKSITLNYTVSGPHGGLAVVEYLIMQDQTIYDLKFTTTAEQSDIYVAAFVGIAESFKLLEE